MKSEVKFSASNPPDVNFLTLPSPLAIGPSSLISRLSIVTGISGIESDGIFTSPCKVGLSIFPIIFTFIPNVIFDLSNIGMIIVEASVVA